MTSRLLATCTLAAVIASPAVAAAQPGVFARAFFELTAAVEGTSGDEGTHIGPALDTMAGALVEWDRSIQRSKPAWAQRHEAPRLVTAVALLLCRRDACVMLNKPYTLCPGPLLEGVPHDSRADPPDGGAG